MLLGFLFPIQYPINEINTIINILVLKTKPRNIFLKNEGFLTKTKFIKT